MPNYGKRAAERAARGLPEPTKCKAHTSDGSRCKNPPIRGATVCRMHGGGAPAVKEAARNRLAMAADGLMQTLLKIAASAESEAVRLAAVKDALDRAGFGAAHMVKLAAVQPWEDFLADVIDDDIFEDVPATRRQRKQRGIGAPHSGGGIDEQEDTTEEDNRTAVRYAADEEDSRTTFNLPGRTIRGQVVPDYGPEPPPEQRAAWARIERRARKALFAADGENPDDEPSEYGGRRSTRPTDPNRPPQYVREAMESDGDDWRAGEGGGSGRADMGL
jgi:hypothetical protein